MQQTSHNNSTMNLSAAINTLAAAITDNKFKEIHIDEDCSEMSGLHHNELFYQCIFDNLNDLILSNCDLNGSKFITKDLKKCLNFTITVNCHSVDNVEFSPLLMDLFLLMMAKTKGNDEKRNKLLDIVGKDRAALILKVLERAER